MTTLRFDPVGPALYIIDQTLLPGEEKIIALHTAEEVREAIGSLRVRGAPAIGVAAGYGFYLGAYELHRSGKINGENIDALFECLCSVRPTAVNLRYALTRMRGIYLTSAKTDILAELLSEARTLEDEDRKSCRAIGDEGVKLLSPGMGIMTICNAGSLAVTEYGTALAPVYRANEFGYNLKIYACETRPLLQGMRLTAYELTRSGADVTVICDNMAAHILKNGEVNAVFAGADRIAKNGDTANKIGTLGLAILAKHFSVPFYICAPLSTFDKNTVSGDDIIIEERSSSEVTDLWFSKRMAPKDIKVRNPAFDVTDASLITAYITERGTFSAASLEGAWHK